MRKFFHNDTSIRVISVLISILLWMYVVGVNNPTVSVVLKGIPVQVANNESFDETGLKVISVSHKTVDVKIEGRHSEVSKVSAADVEASIDVSKISRPGTYNLDIVLNSSDSGVRYTNITSSKAEIFADFVVAVNKDITVKTVGEPREDFAVESVASADSKIMVRGPKSVVDDALEAVAYMDIAGADSDISKSSSLKILNNTGKEIDMTYVTTNITETLVDVKFTQTKEVKINPMFISQEILSDYDVALSTDTVNIIGSASVIKSISVLDTEQIELTSEILSGADDGEIVKATLKLPEGVLLVDDESKEIELTITTKSR